MNIRTLFFSIALIAPLTGCRGPTVNVQPIKIEPIHITMDINIKVDKQLDNFFDFEEKLEAAPAPAAKNTPTPAS